jgi:hypothetical protein
MADREALDVAAEEHWRRTWEIVNRQLGERAPASTVRWEDMPEEHREVWRAVIHRPARGSDVEAYLKERRDEHEGWNASHGVMRDVAWHALDNLLEDYRLRADTGLLLHQDIEEAGP